jgi:hypothetical protein
MANYYYLSVGKPDNDSDRHVNVKPQFKQETTWPILAIAFLAAAGNTGGCPAG